MPDSYGKRQRNAQKARKFAAREERRAARKQERADRAAGISTEEGPPGSEETEPVADGEASSGAEPEGQTEPSDLS